MIHLDSYVDDHHPDDPYPLPESSAGPLELRTMGDACPCCGGTDYYCATQVDRIGRMADSADNYLALLELNMPQEMKLDALTTGIRELSRDLKALYEELSGENPWDQDR
jgi:hypothetical protein